MEKLSSDVLTAKLDSLYTLVTAAPVYGPVAMEPFLEQLWTAIEREVSMLLCMRLICYVRLQMFKSASVDVQVSTCYPSSKYMYNHYFSLVVCLL